MAVFAVYWLVYNSNTLGRPCPAFQNDHITGFHRVVHQYQWFYKSFLPLRTHFLSHTEDVLHIKVV